MTSGNVYILFEGFLREVESEADDCFIISNEKGFQLVPKQNYTVFTLTDLFPEGNF